VWESYRAHLDSLGSALPEAAHRLSTEVSLHDALIRRAEHQDANFELVCRAGDQLRGYVDAQIVYGNVTVSEDDEQFLNSAVGRADIEVLYDEFDSSDARWVHRLLFWPYREVAVHFATLQMNVTRAHSRFDHS